ncbi:hypothetical protein [uncultured Methylophaga sp.]|uniref:hypothetical protein n=1 Tax=uncultured Methylophaga sp. TaxID=285271 RepID=UPI0026269357|nr:hypothetical protein [uncultured Methylophaga sp.]
MPLSPPENLAEFSESEAENLLKNKKGFLIRWESDFDELSISPWWHVIKDRPEAMVNLPKKTRYSIRKASELYFAKAVSLQRIIDDGYPVYRRSYERYDTHEPMLSETDFCEAVQNLPKQTEWWGIFERETDRLVAFSENYIESDTCFFVSMWLEPDAMKKFAGYLLFHEMELHYLDVRGFKYVSDGARSLSHDTNIHDFLMRKFNYRKAYSRLHVVYRNWLGLAIKLAYPFRNVIYRLPLNLFRKASVLLRQESIRRQSESGG